MWIIQNFILSDTKGNMWHDWLTKWGKMSWWFREERDLCCQIEWAGRVNWPERAMGWSMCRCVMAFSIVHLCSPNLLLRWGLVSPIYWTLAGRLVWPYDPAPGRSNHAGLSVRWGFRLKQHRLGSHINALREVKPWQKNHWPSRLWGLGGRPITCPQKIQKITWLTELIKNNY